jgi:hypothetical protein
MGYLFWGLGAHDRPANRKTSPTKDLPSDLADHSVLTDFRALQTIWRDRRAVGRNHQGTQSSREEQQAWKQLMRHLMELPPPRD